MGIPLKVSISRGSAELLHYTKTLDPVEMRIQYIKKVHQCMVDMIDQVKNNYELGWGSNSYKGLKAITPVLLVTGTFLITQEYRKGPYTDTAYKIVAFQVLYALWTWVNYCKIIYSHILSEPVSVDTHITFDLTKNRESIESSIEKIASEIDLTRFLEYKSGSLHFIMGIVAIGVIAFMALSRPFAAKKSILAFFIASSLSMILTGLVSYRFFLQITKGDTLLNQLKACHPAS